MYVGQGARARGLSLPREGARAEEEAAAAAVVESLSFFVRGVDSHDGGCCKRQNDYSYIDSAPHKEGGGR